MPDSNQQTTPLSLAASIAILLIALPLLTLSRMLRALTFVTVMPGWATGKAAAAAAKAAEVFVRWASRVL